MKAIVSTIALLFCCVSTTPFAQAQPHDYAAIINRNDAGELDIILNAIENQDFRNFDFTGTNSFDEVYLFIEEFNTQAPEPRDMWMSHDFHSHVRGYKFHGANFSGMDLSGIDFTRSDFTGANLTGANLTRSALDYSNFSNANLTRANLTDTFIRFANLTGANLSNAVLDEARLDETNFTDANLSGANAQNLEFGFTFGSGAANFTRTNLSNTILSGSSFHGATDFSSANLMGANFSETYFAPTTLFVKGRTCNGATLDTCN